MNKKYVFIFLFVMILLMGGLSSVSAEDTTNDTITTSNINQSSQIIKDTQSVDNDNVASKSIEQDITNSKQANKTLKTDTITVNTYYDLVNQINYGTADTIQLSPGTYITTNNLTINRDLTINGQNSVLKGEHTITINANVIIGNLTLNHTRIIVESNRTFSGSNIVLANNSEGNGSAIYASNGTLIINNSTFTSNVATQHGGAIYVSNGTLIINNSTFTSNVASGYAGAVYTQRSIGNISNSIFTNNSAKNGGVIVNIDGDVTLINSTFTNNSATNTGGVVYIDSNLTVINCIFTNSSSDYAGIVYGSGNTVIRNSTFTNTSARQGGIFFRYYKNITITDSTFINTSTTNGGIIYTSGGDIIINNTVFINSSASNNGGLFYGDGRYNINNSTFTNSSAGVLGGVFYGSSNITVNNSVFNNNSAYNGSVMYRANGITNISNSVFTNNSAVGRGAVFINDGTLSITDCEFTDNYAISYGAGVHVNSGIANISGSIFTHNTGGMGSAIYNNGTLTLTNNTFTRHYANSNGGVIYNVNYITMSNNTFTSNAASYNGSVIYNRGTLNSTLNNFTNNHATVGGVIYNDKRGSINLTDNFTDNYARNNAGVIYNLGSLILTNSNLTSNYVKSEGFVIENQGNMSITNSLFVNNTDNTRDMLFNQSTGSNLTVRNNTYIDNFLENSMIFNQTNIIFKNETIHVNITLRSIYNDTIRNGTIQAYIDDTLIGQADVVNGPIDIPLTINKSATVTLKYITESKHYQNTTLAVQLLVYKNTTITLNPIEPTNNTRMNFTGRIRDMDGAGLKNATIIITLPNGTNITTQSMIGDSGRIDLYIPAQEENSTIIATYLGDESHNATSTSVTVKFIPRESSTTAIISNNTVGNVTVNVTVTNVNGTPVTSGNITIKDQDENIIGTGIVDSEGKSVITTSIDKIGEYTLNVAYNGNTNYLESNVNLENVAVIGIDTEIDVIILNNTFGNTKINVTLTDKTTGTPISDANVVVTLPNDDKIVGITKEDGSVVITLDLSAGDNTITVSYDGSETYSQTSTSLNVNVEGKTTTITVDSVSGVIGEKIILTANIVCSNDELVNGGRVVFKVNGKTLRDADGNIIYVTVSDSKAVIEDFVIPTTWTNSKYEISAVYSGNSEFSSSRSENTTLSITKRNATLTLDKVTAKSGEVVTLSVKITDSTTGDAVTSGKVVFKLNGKTLKDAEGNNIYCLVENGVATIEYTLPVKMSAKDYTLTAVFADKIYERTDINSTLTITN
ncbi:beta strand repeat-containing protein [Methanosphaera sp.]